MSLIHKNLPALFNGVSKQPPILRSTDQTEDELNTWAQLSSGVGKRPATEHVLKIADTLPADSVIHSINRDTTERYFVVIAPGSIRVFSFDGSEKTVNAPGGWAYLAAGGDFSAVTVADYTFIVNRNQKVLMDDVGADEVAPPDYYRMPSKVPIYQGGDIAIIDYDEIYSGAPVQYPTNQSSGGGLTGTVGSMDDLPNPGTVGQIYRVKGNATGVFLDFYVRCSGATVWDETVKPGIRNKIDETTMPHCLVREEDGTFTFAPFSWASRSVGDEKTNPNPTFVNRTIRDVFFYQNRLTFLVDESVVMSEAGNFGNFYRNTVLDLIDSDPVDVAVTTANVAKLDHAVLFNDGAILFADQTQFSLSNSENGVTPASVAIRPVTNYTLNRDTRPIVIGSEAYFIGTTAEYSTAYEYTRLAASDNTTAAEITAHVPGFLPKDIVQIVPMPRGLLALSATGAVFVYQFYWSGDEKIMSAWRPWDLTGNALAASAVDSQIYFVVEHDDGIFVERMELAESARPDQQNRPVFLDRQFTLATSSVDGVTTIDLPYSVSVALQPYFTVVGGEDGDRPYLALAGDDITWLAENQIEIAVANLGTVTAGITFEAYIEPSRQFHTTPQGVPLTTGTLLLRTFTFNYVDSGSFDIEVWPYGKAEHPELENTLPKKIVKHAVRVIGSAAAVFGQAAVASGTAHIMISGEANKARWRAVSRSHEPMTFSSAEWEGFYNRRR